MNAYYSVANLCSLGLSLLPKTAKGVIAKAKRENWQSRPRSGRGGGVEYAFDSLPAEVQAEIKAKQIRAMLPKVEKSSVPALFERDLGDLTDAQRATADARLLMALLVAEYEVELGGRTKSLEYVSQLSRDGALPVVDGTDYNQVCATALAKKSRTGAKVGVGIRKLHEWCMLAKQCDSAEQRLKAFAPQKQGKPEIEPIQIDWLPDFMAFYRNPNGVNVSRAYEQFAYSYGLKHGVDVVPSLSQVRSALDKLPVFVREHGRITGSRMRQLRSYVKRDWNPDWMFANDVWVGDGHLLKLKVRHPIHGHEFSPELTLIMDAPSRFIVGWSLDLSENHLAVADALRSAMVKHGIPAVYYSDNGGGQKNKVLDGDDSSPYAEITGLLPRLGVTHATGIPGNPQGRGIIERVMKEVPSRIAQRFETYFGSGADDETVRRNLVAVKSFARADAQGKELSELQKRGKRILPSWNELLIVIEEEVQRYNGFHRHSSIGFRTPAQMREKLVDDMLKAGLQIVPLSEVEARDMFRPAFVRKTRRGLVEYANGEYFHKDLEPLHGRDVVVFVDIHCPSSVIVRDVEGRFICDAVLDGHKRDAFARSYIENSRERGRKAKVKRAEEKIALANAVQRRVIEHESVERVLDFSAQEDDVLLVESKKYDPFFGLDVEPVQKVG